MSHNPHPVTEDAKSTENAQEDLLKNLKSLPAIIEELGTKHPGIEVSDRGYLTVPVNYLFEFMKNLKEEYGFNYLTNVTSADYLDKFEVVYDVSIIGVPHMIHIKTIIDRSDAVVPSMFPIWGGALWQEREVYDLMGIKFKGHPDLRRIFLEDNFEGHPLRKDFQYEGGRE